MRGMTTALLRARDTARRAALSASRVPGLLRSARARAHAAQHPEQWLTVVVEDLNPFHPTEDGDLRYSFGNHREEAPMLIEHKTLIVDAPGTIGVRVHKLSHTTALNGDGLELYPRTTGLTERACDDESRAVIRIRLSAWAGRPVCTIGA